MIKWTINLFCYKEKSSEKVAQVDLLVFETSAFQSSLKRLDRKGSTARIAIARKLFFQLNPKIRCLVLFLEK